MKTCLTHILYILPDYGIDWCNLHVRSFRTRKRCRGITAAILEPFKPSCGADRDSWSHQSDNPIIIISFLFDQTGMSLREVVGKVIIGWLTVREWVETEENKPELTVSYLCQLKGKEKKKKNKNILIIPVIISYHELWLHGSQRSWTLQNNISNLQKAPHGCCDIDF